MSSEPAEGLIEGIYEPIRSIEFIKDGEYGISILIRFDDDNYIERYVSVNREGGMSYLDY